jgi:site-specific DNA-methyltransferase (cytosine-N4-specific)
MTNRIVCGLKPYIQPFEKDLAIAELSSLTGTTSTSVSGQGAISIDTRTSAEDLAARLSFYETVRQGEQTLPTRQVLREATLYVARNGIPIPDIKKQLPITTDGPLPNRRCLRYGTHGIHEYRGKFFPQLVRSLINVARVPADGVVADPMCGSGTTLVEASLTPCAGIGIDMNPLSVFMSRVKCSLLTASPDQLADEYHEVRDDLLKARPRPASKRLAYFKALPSSDQQYLRNWFSMQVLEDLDVVATRLSSVQDATVRDFMRLALSNIIRTVSWQKSEDLRIRKEIRTDIEIDPIREFLEELGRSVRIVIAFLHQLDDTPICKARIDEGDARKVGAAWADVAGKVDAVITSPPYATALPYLDTDRLSLCYLGLLSRPSHRDKDKVMIGNREITEGIRKSYWARARKEAKLLPKSAIRLIGKIDLLNSNTEAGFRRKNLPALLAKYFFDMREVLAGIAQVLKPGAPAFVVVGDNHTTAGGKRVEIETGSILAELAEMVGLEQGRHVSMDMLVSRDIFKKNAVASETILEFRRPG